MAPETAAPGPPEISTDPATLDIDAIHAFLSERSYWAQAIPRATVERSIANSLCFSARVGGRFAGFARVVTDRATFAWVCDVFVLEEHRGRGIGKALMAAIIAHPDLLGLRSIMLGTRDAHGLYTQFGFQPPDKPQNLLRRLVRDIYRKQAGLVPFNDSPADRAAAALGRPR